MNACVANDMNWSSKAFITLVWPTISACCGGGKIVPVEGTDRKMFDIHAGIDAWQYVSSDGAIRGIASRVQYDTGKNGYPYNTFTIRWSRPNCETEYKKRHEAIFGKRGYVWPFLTVQAYLNKVKNKLMSCGVVRTYDLYSFLDAYGPENIKTIVNKDNSSSFKFVSWKMLIDEGVKVRLFKDQ